MHEYYYDRPLMNGIWEISDKTDGLHTNSIIYLIEGSERALLIDAGNSNGDLAGHVRKLTDKPIDLVITHGHGDHTAGIFQFESVYLSHKDIPMLNEVFGYQLNETMVKDLYSGMNFDLGGCLLEILALPGHSQGSMLLLDRQRQLLFSSDALGSTVLWMQVPHTSPVEAYAKELKNLEQLVKDLNELRIYVGHECNHPTGFTKQYITDIRILAEKIVSGEIIGTPTKDASVLFGGLTASYGEMSGLIYQPDNIFIRRS
jgi:glyoxylase-like metal-dependent hydrolase (beta-lactamase superfamily II)